MIIKTLIRFTDLKENVIREVGEEFEVTKERLEEILLVSANPLVRKIKGKEKEKEEVEKQTKRVKKPKKKAGD